MSLFNSLPHVESCCFCISLKVGSIIIAVLHLLFVAEAISGCGAGYTGKCYTGTMVQVLGWIAIAISLIVLFTAIHFLIGIAKGWPDTAERFLYASALMLIFNVVASICVCFLDNDEEECSPAWMFGVSSLLSCLLYFYFLIVVASYHRVMMYR